MLEEKINECTAHERRLISLNESYNKLVSNMNQQRDSEGIQASGGRSIDQENQYRIFYSEYEHLERKMKICIGESTISKERYLYGKVDS